MHAAGDEFAGNVQCFGVTGRAGKHERPLERADHSDHEMPRRLCVEEDTHKANELDAWLREHDAALAAA